MTAARDYREQLLQALLSALQARPDARSLGVFEGGSAATNRLDQYSDVDLYVVADPTDFDGLFETVEQALNAFDSDHTHLAGQSCTLAGNRPEDLPAGPFAALFHARLLSVAT